MQLYKHGCNTLTLGGIAYPADERGIIEVPDDKITSSVWTQGFVSAAGRLAQLTVRAEPETETTALASSESPTPAERPATDLPSPDQDGSGPVSGPSPKTKPTKEK